jgi:hypothetical protein
MLILVITAPDQEPRHWLKVAGRLADQSYPRRFLPGFARRRGPIKGGNSYAVRQQLPYKCFPTGLGSPPGPQYSEERADWIRKHVIDHMVGQRHRRLAAANGRLLEVLRAAGLDGRRECP